MATPHPLRPEAGASYNATQDLLSAIGSIDGQLIQPGDDSYETARLAWNARFDQRPALILRALSPGDIARGIAAARDLRVPLAVRAGGHSVSGHSAVEDGLLLDLSLLRSIEFDLADGMVRVGGGVLAGELTAAAARHGAAVPLGDSSSVGVSGLTLGGGSAGSSAGTEWPSTASDGRRSSPPTAS